MSRPMREYPGIDDPDGPFSRRAICAAFLGALSLAATVLLYLCGITWQVRPSTFGWVFLLSLGSVLATIIAGTRLRRPAVPIRGRWLAVVAVCLALCSCLGTLPWMGPGGETIMYRFQYANRPHFHKIAQACQNYASTHGTYPPHLAALVAEGSISPADLIDPFSRTTPAVLPSPLAPADWPRIVPLIDAHSDYIYTGANLPQYFPSDIIVLYDKPSPERGGRLIEHFIDQKFVEDASLPQTFAADATRRATDHLPPITPP